MLIFVCLTLLECVSPIFENDTMCTTQTHYLISTFIMLFVKVLDIYQFSFWKKNGLRFECTSNRKILKWEYWKIDLGKQLKLTALYSGYITWSLLQTLEYYVHKKKRIRTSEKKPHYYIMNKEKHAMLNKTHVFFFSNLILKKTFQMFSHRYSCRFWSYVYYF